MSEALNTEEHRQEAAELLRSLVDKIELQPVAGEDRLAIDLHGDLAGILTMAANTDKTLNFSELSPWQEKMVAGVGFEPTTFRL